MIKNAEYGNMVKGIFILVLITFLVMGGLYPTAYLMGGNNLAKDMFNNSEMRKAARSCAVRYLLLSIGITLGIAAVALLVTFLNLIFVGISQIYSFTSVLSEWLIGNITLWLLMWYFGLPNRVLGRY